MNSILKRLRMQKKHFWHRIVVSIAIVLTFCGCTNALDEFSKTPCRVVIDNALHLDATLASAMNSVSSGVFCVIRETTENGVQRYIVSSNYSLSSSFILNAIELKTTRIVGMNNGIIVGFGNLDNPAIFYAYDRECPNCYDPDVIPIKSRPLSIDEKGWATCKVCNRVYNLNNRGYIIEGEQGLPLTRYRAQTSGPYGTLSVY